MAIDQGGCVETSKPTTHGDPTFIVDDVVHYCVANMPGGVPRTSTFALNKVTLPYLVKLANKGYQKALSEDKNFLAGLNIFKGQVTYKAVAEVFGYDYVDPSKLFNYNNSKYQSKNFLIPVLKFVFGLYLVIFFNKFVLDKVCFTSPFCKGM